MKVVFTISLVISAHILLSQNKDLVIDQGIGPFKFESHVSVWDEVIEGTVQISYGQDYYRYSGSDLQIFYSLKVNTINLGFFEDRLNYIDYYFRKLDDQTFKALLDLMNQDYGQPKSMENPDQRGLLEAYLWDKGEISLELKRYSNEAIDWGDRDMTVIVCQKRIY